MNNRVEVCVMLVAACCLGVFIGTPGTSGFGYAAVALSLATIVGVFGS